MAVPVASGYGAAQPRRCLMNNHPAIRRQTLSDLLHRTAARLPHKTGIVCGDTRWTWREFDVLVSRLAAGLHAQGVAKGEHVGVLSRNSHGFAALRFALARLGAVMVPVNFMLNADEAAYILRHAGVKLLAVDSGLHALGRDAAQRDTQISRFLWLPGEDPSTCPRRLPGLPRAGGYRPGRPPLPGARLQQPPPAADRLHQRHREPAEGRDADAWRSDRPVRQLHRRGRDGRGRRGAACAAAVPLRAAGRVPGPQRVPGQHQHHHRQADAREPAAADREAPRQPVLPAAHGVDRGAALARCSRPATCPACARAITARRSCRWR